MTPYKSKSGKYSGVTAYQIGRDYIAVQFNHSEVYKYTYSSAGKAVIEKMKSLALANKGLSTYISRHQPPYA
jgi:hypothetical protein